LQISDASGVADASMFSEALSACRDLIEIGNIVVMDITCNKNDDQIRITVDKMRKFDAAKTFQPSAKSAAVSTTKSDDVIKKPVTKILQLKIDNKKELLAIKNLIDNFPKNGNYFIELLTPEKILLPDKYFITSYDILDLRNIVGVDNAKEVTKQ
jgi:DNA polymerase III alpha subunit